MAYVAETRASKTIARCLAEGYGVVIQRGRVTKAKIAGRWMRWIHDNAAFADFNNGRVSDFDGEWRRDILAILDLPADHRPDFSVLPDIVAGGLDSLRLSLSWLHRLGRTSVRWAIAVQDGMTPNDIPWAAPFDVIFVGGSIDWKLNTMAKWAAAARDHGRTCHVGRMGSGRRVRWAKEALVDSIDSALPLWSEAKLEIFADAMKSPTQLVLGGPGAWS